MRAGPSLTEGTGIVTAVMIAVVVGLSAEASRWLSFAQGNVSLFWPPAGLLLVAVVRHGLPALVPGGVGIGLWALLHDGDPRFAAVAIAASLVGPLVASLLLSRWLDREPLEAASAAASRLGRGRIEDRWLSLASLGRFYAVEFAIAAPLAAAVGAAGTQAIGEYGAASPVRVMGAWWLAEAVGALLFAPMLLAAIAWREAWAQGAERRGSAWPDPLTMLAALAIGVGEVALRSLGQHDVARVLLYLTFPLLAQAGMRFEALKSHGTIALAAMTVMTARAAGVAADGSLEPGSTRFYFELFETAVVGVVGVMLAQLLQAVGAERRRAFARLEQQAARDALTGELNERGFVEAVARRTSGAGAGAGFVVAVAALPGFDTAVHLHGYGQAGRALREFCDGFKRATGGRDTARIDAASFATVVALPPDGDGTALLEAATADAHALQQRLAGLGRLPLETSLNLHPVVTTIVVPPGSHGLAAEPLLIAVRQAASDLLSGSGAGVARLAPDADASAARRDELLLLEHVRAAIRMRTLHLHGQPIVAADPGEAAGQAAAPIDFEVLARLAGPDGSPVSPGAFLSMVAQAGLSGEFDRAVIAQTIAWFAAHPDALARTAKCAINLSGPTLSDPALPAFVAAEFERHRIAPQRFAFEITESEAVLNPAAAAATLNALRAMGCRIAVDDFGTGFATYDYLKRFPIDYVKIDGSFVRNVTRGGIDEEIVGSIVRIARRLGIHTVAEHVSDAAIRAAVARLGVERVQGHAVAMPMPLAALFAKAATASVR